MPNPSAIVGIDVVNLFGHYSYSLRQAPEMRDRLGLESLILLYGDNGSGKTTISKLLFHMLSSSDGAGHRTFIAQTKFEKFSILFDNGSRFEATRSSGMQVGPYSLSVSNGGDVIAEVEVHTDEEGAVKTGTVDDQLLQEVLEAACDDKLEVFFLSDNRSFEGDSFRSESFEWGGGAHDYLLQRRHAKRMEGALDPSQLRALMVEMSVNRVESWLRKQAIQASRIGEETTSTIYSDIIRRIVRVAIGPTKGTGAKLEEVIAELGMLSERSAAFSALGLAQPVPAEDLPQLTKFADEDQKSLLASVLQPYVTSIKSRLDAYGELEQRLSSFQAIINGLYKRKSIRVTPVSGIEVIGDDGVELEIGMLSSGEKQILLLLCNILVSTTQPSLFIIDEPELSLNVKWQRELLGSLLSLVEGSNVQFIMATHSIEILARHQECVLKLEEKAT